MRIPLILVFVFVLNVNALFLEDMPCIRTLWRYKLSHVKVGDTIQTPNYPKNYPDRQCLAWMIDNHNKSCLKLVFDEKFGMEDEYWGQCPFDYLQLKVAGRRGRKRICGKNRPADISISSRRRAVLLTFVSDKFINDVGFKIKIQNCESATTTTTSISSSAKPGTGSPPPTLSPTSNCGKPTFPYASKQSFIMGGENARGGSWPWQVQLLFRGQHWCGGTLLNKRWAMTATHCFNRDRSTDVNIFEITVGNHHYNTQDPHQRTIKISRIVHHPDYRSARLWGGLIYLINDITLVELSEEVTYNDYIKPVCLPSNGISQPSATTSCYSTGWGRTEKGHPLVLKQTRQKLISLDDCRKIDRHVKKGMLCAGNRGENWSGSPCGGDSGGPLVCRRSSSDPWSLVGVVSYGDKDCREISVYTNVTSHLAWVNGLINT